MNEQRNYDAFISYRHTDSIIAKALHIFLENLRIVDQTTGKKRRLVIFRDRDELPVSESLPDNINSALRHSKYLIVLISSTFQDSEWCMKELEYFRSLHNNTNYRIIPLLIEGEPDSAFPSVLRYQTVQTLNADGSTTSTTERLEPLAADVRASNLFTQLVKLYRTEALRVASPILGVPFANLYQRHKRRAIVATAAIVTALVIATAAFCKYRADVQAEMARTQGLRLLDASSYPAEDDPTLAMMLAETGCDQTPAKDGIYYERALATFRERAIDAGIDLGRSPFKAIWTIEYPTSSIKPLHCYKNGQYLSVTDGEQTYLYDVALGKQLFMCAGTEVWFDPSLSYAFSYRIANRKKTMTGYRVANGEVIFEYETDILKQAPLSMEVWFDSTDSSAYIIEPDRVSDNVVALVALNEPDTPATLDPKVPEHAKEAMSALGLLTGKFLRNEFIDTILQGVESPYPDLQETLYKDPNSDATFWVAFNRLSSVTENSDYLGEEAADETLMSYLSNDATRSLSITGNLDGWLKNDGSPVHLRVCDLAGGEDESLLDVDLYVPSRQLYLCATDHEMLHVVYMDTAGTVQLYDAQQDKELAADVERHPDQINTLAVDDNGQTIVLGRFVRTSRTEDWEYLLEFYEVTQSSRLKLVKTVDFTDQIDHRHGSAITHIELTNDYVFVSGEESVVVFDRDALLASSKVDEDCIVYGGYLGMYGGCSDPLPQFLTSDGLLFCTKGGVYGSTLKQHDLFGIYDLTLERDVPFGNGIHANAFTYDPSTGFLTIQTSNANSGGVGAIRIYRLNENREFSEARELLSSEHDLVLPSWKSCCDGTHLLVENDNVTQVYNLESANAILTLNHVGLSLSNGRLFDSTRTIISDRGSYPISMDYNDLKTLSARIRQQNDGSTRTFTDEERSKYGIDM